MNRRSTKSLAALAIGVAAVTCLVVVLSVNLYYRLAWDTERFTSELADATALAVRDGVNDGRERIRADLAAIDVNGKTISEDDLFEWKRLIIDQDNPKAVRERLARRFTEAEMQLLGRQLGNMMVRWMKDLGMSDTEIRERLERIRKEVEGAP